MLRVDAATHEGVVYVDGHEGRRARGRIHAVRGRRHRPGARGRRGADHDRREQRADERDDPAGHDLDDRGGPPQAGLPPRLLQLRGTGPLGDPVLGARDPGDRRHRDDRRRRVDRQSWTTASRPRATPRSASSSPTPPAPRSRRRTARRAGSPWRMPNSGVPVAAICTTLRVEALAGRERRRRLRAAGRHPLGPRRRRAVPHQRRAVHLPRFRQARRQRVPRPRVRQRRHGARLLTHGVDRRELVPDVALPLRRGVPRLRRPSRDRRDRRDGGGRSQPRHRRRVPRCASASPPSRRRCSTTRRRRRTPRASAN